MASSLELSVVLEASGLGGNESLVLGLSNVVDGGLSGQKSGLLNQGELLVLAQLAKKVDEGLLVVVVRLDGDLVVGKGLTAMVVDLLGGNLTLSNVDLVSAKNNGDAGADTLDITMPVRDVSVGKTISNVEHDDGGLASNVVALTEP